MTIDETEVIFRCRFGSHLYGTNTPESDYDEKGIFIETLENIILRRDSRSLHFNTGNDRSRNTKNDCDIELKELRTFLKEAMDGQTYALDMLFCNAQNTLTTSETWKFIQENRSKLISKNVKPFIGYCRQQCGKYGLKGSRLAELERVLQILSVHNPKDRLRDAKISESEFVRYISDDKVTFLEVLGKRFHDTVFVKMVTDSLEGLRQRYGARAELAKENNGVDWKAVSHAYRCMYEVKSLLLTGNIVFPLPEAAHLVKIKRGEYNWNEINNELPAMMAEVEKIAEASPLPQEPVREFWDRFVLNAYLSGVPIA